MHLCSPRLHAGTRPSRRRLRSNGEHVPQQTQASAAASALPFSSPGRIRGRPTQLLWPPSIRRGRALIHSTRDSLPRNVGGALTCANCHIGPTAHRPMRCRSWARIPVSQYRARSGHVDLLEDRINDCFKRSMNGKALDTQGRDMRDIVTYIAFLSRGYPPGSEMKGQGVPKLDLLLRATRRRGWQIFATTWVLPGHGADGNGSAVAPPLWGPRSFNIGAGMARSEVPAAFIHQLMPRNHLGTLTPQQAFDVATYISTRPRPDFPGKGTDWPHGGTPPDVAYSTMASRKTAGNPAPAGK